MRLIRKYAGYLILLVLPAYFLLLENSIRNKHTHVLANGLVVTHSHPLQKNEPGKPFNQHGHSKREIHFFQLFSVDFFENSSTLYYTSPVPWLLREIIPGSEDKPTLNVFLTCLSRAPPALSA